MLPATRRSRYAPALAMADCRWQSSSSANPFKSRPYSGSPTLLRKQRRTAAGGLHWSRSETRIPRRVAVKHALLVFGIGILSGRFAGLEQQPREPDLRLLRFPADELDQKHPLVAIVEEKTHLGPDGRKGLDDARPLDAPCTTLALSAIDKQLVPDGRLVNVSLQPAIETKGMVEVEIEEADNRLGKGVQATDSGNLEGAINFRPERRAKHKGLGVSHSTPF